MEKWRIDEWRPDDRAEEPGGPPGRWGANLRGVVWVLVQVDGRLEVQRLEPMVLPGGGEVANDVFATDQAAREFVERLAALGDTECQQVMVDVDRDVDWWAEERLARRRSPLATKGGR